MIVSTVCAWIWTAVVILISASTDDNALFMDIRINNNSICSNNNDCEYSMCMDMDSCNSAIIACLIGKNDKAVFGHSPTGRDH